MIMSCRNEHVDTRVDMLEYLLEVLNMMRLGAARRLRCVEIWSEIARGTCEGLIDRDRDEEPAAHVPKRPPRQPFPTPRPRLI